MVAERGGDSGVRYRMLETLRAFARERLENAGETRDWQEAHARFFLDLAERAEPDLTGPHQERWFTRLEVERTDLRAALEWSLGHGKTEWALRLAGALVLFWRVRCHFSEGRDLLRATVSAAGSGAPRALRAKALWGAGFMTMMAGDPGGAIAALEESLTLAQGTGDLQGSARALLLLGNCFQSFAPLERTATLLEKSAALAREAADPWCLSHALAVAGFGYSGRGDFSAARAAMEESLDVAREARDAQGLRAGLLGLGTVAMGQGDWALAQPLLEEAGNDGLRWPRRDGLMWPHLASVVCVVDVA